MNYIGPTPYDAEIAKRKLPYPSIDYQLERFEALAEGYRLAKAQDAVLLEALGSFYFDFVELIGPGEEGELPDVLKEDVRAVRAAIAQAEGKE